MPYTIDQFFSSFKGRFKIDVGEPNLDNTVRTIDLVCRNGANDAPPFWDPPYDHLINPFPECVFIREYFFVLFVFRKDKKEVEKSSDKGKWYFAS